MNQRVVIAASGLLVIFGVLMAAMQVLDYNSKRLGMASVAGSFAKGQDLARLSTTLQRDSAVHPAAGSDRQLDFQLPPTARVFLTGMVGVTNAAKAGYYYFLAYYLFPRDVAVTLDQPRFTAEGIQGRSTDSDAEMLANGFDVRVDPMANDSISVETLHDLPLREVANPGWFGSPVDAITAFLLPLLTSLSGMWLLRLMFGPLIARQPLAEQLACGFGLGMMAVAALTLGVKLCGFHGRGWVLTLTVAGALGEIWRDRKVFGNGITDGFRKIISRPVVVVIVVIVAVVFLILFRLAALQGIVEFDAVAAWLLKAKILFFSTGHELVGWFSNPRLAYAHMDYPTLVPALHAATYDSIGHVDEFVTKFWPTWMLFFLLLGLASLGCGNTARFHAPFFFLLGVLLLPFTQAYVQMEGGTLPMTFFTVFGFVQCALGLAENAPFRIGLGLTLLFGAAMSKFEGMIFLALTAGWILVLPSARPHLKVLLQFWRAPVFCFLAALPFLCLRAQIPVLDFEAKWPVYALASFGTTLFCAPKIFLIILAREFANSGFAQWGTADGRIHWTGHWNGFSSLLNHRTYGLAWLCLLIAILLWLVTPARRLIVIWALAVFLSAVAVLSVVFASFVSVSGLNDLIFVRTADNEAGRYLFPMLLAWAAAMAVVFFRDDSPSMPVTSDKNKTPPICEGKAEAC